jgi:hypothetical protein
MSDVMAVPNRFQIISDIEELAWRWQRGEL